MVGLKDALPLSVFLVMAFLAFYFMETVILFFLNHCLRKYCLFIIDKVIFVIVRHRTLVRLIAAASLAILFSLLFMFTPVIDLLVEESNLFRWLALILLLAMIVIYFMAQGNIDDIVIAKRIHLYFFIAFSMCAFSGVMMAAKGSYAIYDDLIDRAFVQPIVADIEEDYEKRLEDRLVNVFRNQVKKGECGYIDYATSGPKGLTQFVFIKNDPALADARMAMTLSTDGPLRGKRCVHETEFLLTPEGKWYEVIN